MTVDYSGWSELAVTDVVSGLGLKSFLANFLTTTQVEETEKLIGV